LDELDNRDDGTASWAALWLRGAGAAWAGFNVVAVARAAENVGASDSIEFSESTLATVGR